MGLALTADSAAHVAIGAVLRYSVRLQNGLSLEDGMSARAQCLLFSDALCVCPGCSRDDSKRDSDSSEHDASPAEDIDRPPEPNFIEPVDYLAWYSARNFDPDWPDGEQVYGEILAAAEDGTFPMPDDTLTKKLRTAARGTWSADEMPEVAAYIESLDPYLDLFAKAAEVDNVRWFANATMAEVWAKEWPSLKLGMPLARATLAKAWLKSEGKPCQADALLDAWRINLVHARHQEHNTSVGFPLSLGIRAIVYQSIASALSTGILAGDEYAAVLNCVVGYDQPPNLAEAYRSEWIGLLGLLQELYPGGRFSDAAAKRLGQAQYLPPGGVFLPRPQKTAKRIDEWFLPIVRLAEEPWSFDRMKAAKTLSEGREKIAGRNVLLTTFLPGLSMKYTLAMQLEARQRGMMVTLAVHVFREEHGQWPDTLDACRSHIEDVRVDPFSGKDFVYELRDGTPWLYSVGCDGKDSGGKHDPRWARKKPGHDYVFWPTPQTVSRR